MDKVHRDGPWTGGPYSRSPSASLPFITVIWPILSIIGRSKSLASFPASPSEFSGSTPAVFYDRVNSKLVTWL